MQRLTAVFIYFLIALCFSGNIAKAQELTAIPAKIQGNWALPHCGIYDEALLFTRYFYLKSAPAGISLRPAGLDVEGEDYMILALDGAAAPVQVENDGIMTLGILEKSPAKRTRNWPRQWDSLPHDQTVGYASCADAPSVLPPNMVRLMRYIDRMRDECSITGSKGCARVIFKLADSNNNNRLSTAEIKAATESLMLLAEMGAQKTLNTAAVHKVKARATVEGTRIAADLMARYDANKSGDLDYNEIVENFTPPALPIIREMAQKAGHLLPALHIAASALPRISADEAEENTPAQRPAARRKHY